MRNQPMGSSPQSADDEWVAIVDDDESVRHSLARIVRASGVRARTFASAEDYLSRDAGAQPCCLVLDVQLGGLSGFDLCDHITACGDETPVIFMTAHDDIASTQLAFRSGSWGYLRKPFYADALLALVLPHLTLTRSEQSVR